VIAPKDLPRRIVVANGRPLIDEHNHNLGAVVSMRDVTEQKKSEKQLRLAITELHRANTELSRSNHELEQFAYIASHDLQEPLRKIQAFGDRLKTKYREELPDTGKEYIERMQSAAGRMRKLIDDLLTFSRVTTHVRPMAPVDLRKLMAEVLSDLSERLESTRGQIHVGDLPEIDGDNSQFRQLFQNLIANALKFHKPDMPPVVEISSEYCEVPTPGDPMVTVPATRIRVKDQGIGFEEKYLDRIFQVFQRLHGRDEYEGTGVGLAICRKIVERHGGILTAESQPGVGAEFIITVPLRQPQPEENPEYLPLRTDN
jgi:light-regulated signal transduction histidine kinase (bacteriophytochrome)